MITEVAGEIVSYGSTAIGGKVIGDGNIRNVVRNNGGGLNISGDLSEFQGDFIAEQGTILFGRYIDGFSSALSLNSQSELHVHSNSSIAFQTGDAVVENDIYLHNADGFNQFEGALSVLGNGRPILAGRIDVGDKGSTLADDFVITGEFTGNNLNLIDGSLDFRSKQSQLRGTLNLDGGSIILNEAGALHGLDEITLQKGSRIYLAPNSSTDRIDDETLIRSRGGAVSLNSDRSLRTSELLGTLLLERGSTSIFASSDHGSDEATLAINRIERESGATLNFDNAGLVTTTQINSVDTFETSGDTRMIGGWAVTEKGFATIDQSGFVGTLQATSTNINTAGSSDHVAIGNTVVLNSDKTIASLGFDFEGELFTLDLNGHRLAVRSGGIFYSRFINNGTITAGDTGEDTDLVLHHRTDVSSDIVDNSETGSVGLVIAPHRYSTTLSGSNTYTGGTRVQGSGDNGDQPTLIIETIAAIPENDRVYLDGGRYDVSRIMEGTIELSELHLRDGAEIFGANAPIDADAIYIEDGRFAAPLSGEGVIYKQTKGYAHFSEYALSPDFTGQVHVQEGTLSYDENVMPQATYHISGGRLSFQGNNHGLDNEINLNGGAIAGGVLFGDILVQSDSTIVSDTYDTTIYGKLVGDANLNIDGEFGSLVSILGDASQFTGDFDVRSSTLRIGAPATLGEGEITVREGGRLMLSSERYSSTETVVDNTVHLRGGTLFGAPPGTWYSDDSPSNVLSGDVYVHTEAFIGASSPGSINGEFIPGLTFSGRLILEAGANVYGLSNDASRFYSGDFPLLEISGDLLVGEETTWNLATASVLVSGNITPTAANSSINFDGVGSSLVLNGTKIVSDAEKSLSIKLNGRTTELSLEGSAILSGNGHLEGDFKLSDDASLSPGNSPGELTIIGNTTIGNGAVYEWEITSATGVPGSDWDLLTVDGDLIFDVSPDEYWVLDVILPAAGSFGASESWLIASAENIVGFDSKSNNINLVGTNGPWSSLTADNFQLEVRDGNIYLNLIVPEPSSLLLISIGLVSMGTRKRL